MRDSVEGSREGRGCREEVRDSVEGRRGGSRGREEDHVHDSLVHHATPTSYTHPQPG